MRLAGILTLVLCLAGSAAAQTNWNPKGWRFDHEPAEVEKTGSYLFEVKLADGSVIGRWEIPKDKIRLVGPATDPTLNTYEFDPDVYPALPVGATYEVALAAKGTSIWDGTSAFTVSPDRFRVQPCVSANGVLQPLRLTFIGPAGWKVGERATLHLSFDTPAPIRALSVDLLGDGLPAWYFAGAALERDGVLVGPPARAGRFPLTATAIDDAGCVGELPAGTMVDVVP